MIDELLKYDTQLFHFLNNWGNENWDGFWLFITNKWSSIPLYTLLLYLVFKNFGIRVTLLIMVCAALMITATDQLANLFKYGFQRPRPCQVAEFEDTIRFIAVRCGRYGFFSAHAASTMAVAVFLGLLFKNIYYYLIFILMFWAVLTGYSRIYLGVHYPFDIITGMFFGGIIGWLFYLLQNWARNRFTIS